MQASPPECFEREMSCSESDWLRWLPEAIGDCRWTRQGRMARVELGTGAGQDADPDVNPAGAAVPGPALTLAWQPLPPLSIALLALPRLRVGFRFERASATERQQFMRRFDLYLQRGGG
ncbi:MAG: hypothetical protein RLZZ555_1671 [Pseudomonadota bacterium]|jgi:hypothetical protein